jgi:hypothetical protein
MHKTASVHYRDTDIRDGRKYREIPLFAKTGSYAHELVVHAVPANASARVNSLLTGKITGTISKSGRFCRKSKRKGSNYQMVGRSIPYASEQGINARLQGIKSLVSTISGKISALMLCQTGSFCTPDCRVCSVLAIRAPQKCGIPPNQFTLTHFSAA